MMNKTLSILFASSLVLIAASCGKAGKDNPGIEYAPDMYVSKGYEPYKQLADKPFTLNPHGMAMRTPVEGTVARGQIDFVYPYANTNEGYEMAKANLRSPLDKTEANLAEGAKLYMTYCAVCHGKEGLANGTIVEAGKYPPPPSYQSDRIKTLAEGGMYHSITYGKNLMGSYASVLTPKERWQVIQHIQLLSGTSITAAPADTTAIPSDTTGASAVESNLQASN